MYEHIFILLFSAAQTVGGCATTLEGATTVCAACNLWPQTDMYKHYW